MSTKAASLLWQNGVRTPLASLANIMIPGTSQLQYQMIDDMENSKHVAESQLAIRWHKNPPKCSMLLLQFNHW
jgi:hypothetical protein